MSIKTQVQAVIDGISTGKILETFDAYYADDVVMSENRKTSGSGKWPIDNMKFNFLKMFRNFMVPRSDGRLLTGVMPRWNGPLT
ncbi:MAG: hypothetical protein WD425_01590 [Nitrospirales bacterium]